MRRIAADLSSAILLSTAVFLLSSTASSATVFYRLPCKSQLFDSFISSVALSQPVRDGSRFVLTRVADGSHF